MTQPVQNPFIPEYDYFDRRINGLWITGKDTTNVMQTYVVHGEHPTLGAPEKYCGAQGVYLAAKQVKGIWDAPIKTTWKAGAFQDGSTQKAKKWLHRDMELGFHIKETVTAAGPGLVIPLGAEENEGRFRSLFAYDEDEYDDDPQPVTLHIDTDISGERKLDVLMYDAPLLEPDLDPIMLQHFNTILRLRAGQPFWYEDDVVSWDASTATSGTLTVTVSNPTDQPMKHKWVLTRGTFQVPDFSWRGGKSQRHPGGTYQNRRIEVNVTDENGGCVISLNKGQDLPIRDLNYTNMAAQLGGKLFQHVIPPYTQPQTITIPYINAPAGVGARVELHQPRLWSRPWGME